MSISTAKQVCIILATYQPNLIFLKKQIDSIISQTYKNWICWVADDGSSSEKLNSIQEIISQDKRFIFVSSNKRLGPVNNFEFGLNQAQQSNLKFDYIAFSDQDDIWEPNKIEKLVEVLEKNAGISLVHSDLSLIDEKDQLLALSCWQKEHRKLDIINYESLVFRNVVTGCSCMFRRSVLKTALAFEKLAFPPPYYHDVWIALHALYAGSIFSLDEPLVRYRQHSRNVVGAQGEHNFIDLFKNIFSRSLFLSKAKNAFLVRNRLVNDFLYSLDHNQMPINANIARAIQYIRQNFLSNYLYPLSLGQFFRLIGFTFCFAKTNLGLLKNGLQIAIGHYVLLKNIDTELPIENHQKPPIQNTKNNRVGESTKKLE